MTRHTSRVTIAAALLLCAACGGSSIEGTYSGQGTGFLEKIVFKSDGKVELTFMGMTKEGTYVVEDGRVKITNGGDTSILAIAENGCLEGGGILGKYCKAE